MEIKVKDRKGKVLKSGQNVIWHDPEKKARNLKNIYVVDEIISEEMVYISNKYSFAEVLPEELEIVKTSNNR